MLDRDLTAPPGSPAEGQRWIVKATGTGAWAATDNAIAAWQDGAWQFSAPQTGWLAYVVDEGALLAWTGSAWADAISALTSLNNMTLLGVGTIADGSNPFSAKLNNTLFVAKTVAEGGTGDMRYKLSKESAAKTLSLPVAGQLFRPRRNRADRRRQSALQGQRQWQHLGRRHDPGP